MATACNAPPVTAHRQALVKLWILWVAASVAGFALAAAAFWALSEAYRTGASSAVRIIAFLATVTVGTTAPGFLHWLILRQRFAHAAWWLPASAAGTALGFVALAWGFAVGDTRGDDASFWHIVYGWLVPNAAVALGGAVAGTLQWFVLKRWVAHAGWWLPASAMSWVLSTWTYMTVTRGNDVHPIPGALASGLVSGIVTGLALVCLLPHSYNARSASAVGRTAHRRPLLLAAAWMSPIIPLVVAALVWWGARSGPYRREDMAVVIGSFAACGVGLLAAFVGLLGIKANGIPSTLAAVVLGLLLNGTIGAIALLMWVLSGLPQSP